MSDSFEERMREAQRLGRVDALSGRPFEERLGDPHDDAWLANYMLGRMGPEYLTPPPSWPEAAVSAVRIALLAELADRVRPRIPLVIALPFPMASQPRRLAARRRAALGIRSNGELPVLRRSPVAVGSMALIALVGLAARSLALRTSVTTLVAQLALGAAQIAAWRRAGLPTRRHRPG